MNSNRPVALEGTNFDWLGERYVGKVRDSYVRGDQRILVASDRLSAFDRILTTVPGKGQVLTQLAKYWFDRCSPIVKHHVVAVPDPCVMVGQEVSIVPVEVVVRGYLAGSSWRDYVDGRPVSGVSLPRGMKQFEAFAEPIITPSTKEAVGKHDEPISEQDIVKRGIVSAALWEEIRSTALSLFKFGAKEVESRGLLFADTKYEFGVRDGQLFVADEMHTLDCSRFWVADTYERCLNAGDSPEMLDKEPIRRWLLERGFKGEGQPPVIPDEYRNELTDHYVRSFEKITGRSCVLDTSPPLERIERNLHSFFGIE